jgi:hypothetical protein
MRLAPDSPYGAAIASESSRRPLDHPGVGVSAILRKARCYIVCPMLQRDVVGGGSGAISRSK